jgi:nucleoside-diphosphate-sugar epimerase
VPYDGPITENSPRRGYPGVYALTKITEEVMLEQAGIQYGVNWTTLRAPWIMEKDDFKFALSFGEDQFGGPDWDTLLPRESREDFARTDSAPLLIARDGKPLRRNFIHVDDLVSAILTAFDHPAARQQLFNIAMTDPVDYGVVAEHLRQTRGMPTARIETPFVSNLLDNAKARLQLGWQPEVDTLALVDRAFAYERSPADPRKVWYPG